MRARILLALGVLACAGICLAVLSGWPPEAIKAEPVRYFGNLFGWVPALVVLSAWVAFHRRGGETSRSC